jgi:sugar phosphate isomerase/epimerase
VLVEIAVHLHSLRRLPPADALEAATAMGFDAVELWLPHGERDELAAAVLASDLRVVAVGGLGVYAAGDVGAAAEAGELAAAVGAPVVVGCIHPDHLPEAIAAVPQGVRLAVENHWDQPLARAREVRRAVAGAEQVGACLDTGHALLAGELPEAAARELGGTLHHVHAKDAVRAPALRRVLGRRVRRRLLGRPAPVFPGSGDLDAAAFVGVLAELGYDGAVTLEYEGEDAETGLAALNRIVAGAIGRASDGSREPRVHGA